MNINELKKLGTLAQLYVKAKQVAGKSAKTEKEKEDKKAELRSLREKANKVYYSG